MCFKELQIQAVLLLSPLRERGNSLKFPDTAEFGGISVNRSKIVDLQGCHPRVGGDPPLKQTWIPSSMGMTIVN